MAGLPRKVASNYLQTTLSSTATPLYFCSSAASQLYTLEGETLVGSGSGPSAASIKQYHTAVLSNHEGETGVWLESVSDRARFVLVAGEPLEQEIVQHGPFVMTSRSEIQQTFMDYQFQRNVSPLVFLDCNWLSGPAGRGRSGRTNSRIDKYCY